MTMLRALNPFAVLAICMFIATGCNAFEFMYSDDSDEPEVLLDDARLALQTGDTDKAIELLTKALEKAPENAEIKIELSSALFQANDIDLLGMKELAEFISEPPSVSGKQVSGMQTSDYTTDTCNFQSTLSATELQFTQSPAYQSLESNVDVLEQSIVLLSQTLDNEEADDLAENLLSNGYLMRAISNMAISVIEVKLQADAAGAKLYRLPGGNIGYCANDAESLAQLETFVVCDKLPTINHAINDLISRQSLFSLGDTELVNAVSAARDHITDAITVSCTP